MAITYDSLTSYAVPEVAQTLSDTDCILYALGVGFGTEPVHPGHLRHVYEEGLEVLPMMANVVAYPGFWLKDPATGVDWRRVLHGEQVFTIHRPIPIGVKLRGRTGSSESTTRVRRSARSCSRGAMWWSTRRAKRYAPWSRRRCFAATAAAAEATRGRAPFIGFPGASTTSIRTSRSPGRRR